MSSFRVSKALRLAAGLLAAAACSDSGAAPLASAEEVPVVPPVHALVIHDVHPAGFRQDCQFFAYQVTFRQGAREVDGFTAVTYLDAADRVTRVIPLELFREKGIDPGRELVMTWSLAGLGTASGAAPGPACTAEAGRRWQFRGTLEHVGGRVFWGDFASFAYIGR